MSANRRGYHRLAEASPTKGDHIGFTTMIKKIGNRTSLQRPFLLLILLAVLAVTLFFGTRTTVHAQSVADGESVFTANCAVCHSTGTDPLVGPGLAGIVDRAPSEDYIRESILDPGAVIVEGFLDAMPATVGASLSSGDLESLIAYLGTLSEPDARSPEPELISAPAGEGNAERGENLFTGPNRFENRGPSCAACHSSSGIGAFGGGSLGPDLTGAYAKLGDALIVWPETVAPMSPIFSERPLTDQEKSDLLAFFKSADISARETAQVVQLFGVAVGGVVIIALFTQLIWRRRLRGVRKSMVPTTALSSDHSGNILKRLLTGLFWDESATSSRR